MSKLVSSGELNKLAGEEEKDLEKEEMAVIHQATAGKIAVPQVEG